MKNLINNVHNSSFFRLVLLLASVIAVNTFSMHLPQGDQGTEKEQLGQQKDELSKKKGLLIFLDDSEKNEFGAITNNFLIALYQEASPILVSTSLLYSVFEQSQKDTRPINVLLNEMKGNDIVLSRICFKPEQWIIKKINNFLNLLIPVSYVESLNIAQDKVKEYGNAIDGTSDVELQLGFKVNHMETIESMQISNPNPVLLADYFIDSLGVIFCKKSDYHGRKIDIPEWIVVINGHGLTHEAIVDLSFDDFKKLLHFLEHEIITQLFVGKSCYIAGVNSEKIYGEIKQGTQQYYPFPVIVQGLNDMATSSRAPKVDWSIWRFRKKVSLRTEIDFVDFFNKAKKLESNYEEIMKPITLDFVESIPQIKLPGIEWFSVMDIDKKIVSIGSILAKTRNPQVALDIVSFFKKDPEIILLYTDNIPFELRIDSRKVTAIISMVSSGAWEEMPDLVIHRIKEISSTQTFAEIMQWFASIAESNGDKMFLIDKVGTNTDIIIFRTDDQLVGVYAKNKNNDLVFAAFKEGDNIKFEHVESDSDEENDYQGRLSIAHNEYPEASQEIKKEITPQQIKKIENVLIKQREKQKKSVVKSSPLIQ